VNATARALATLVGAAAAGCLIWLAAQINDKTTGGYWAVYGLIAAGGLILGLAQLRGRGGNPPAMFLIAFLPVLVAAGWVVLAAQPHANWFRGHVLAWSGDIGIKNVVKDLIEYVSVLAFGVGVVFGLTFEPGMLRRKRGAVAAAGAAPATAGTTTPAYDRTAADEPTAAERHEVGDEPVVDERAGRRDTARR
jgi:hypothetical protein